MNAIKFQPSDFFSASDVTQGDSLILTARKNDANETEFVTVPNTFFGRTICFFFRDATKIAEVASADLEKKYGSAISEIFNKKSADDLVGQLVSKSQVVQFYTDAKDEVFDDEMKEAMKAAETAKKSLEAASTLGSETQEKRDVIKKCYTEAITAAEQVEKLWGTKEQKLRQEYCSGPVSTSCASLPLLISLELAHKERRQANQRVIALMQKEHQFTADNIRAWELELDDVESAQQALLRAERSQGEALKVIAKMAGWRPENSHDPNGAKQQD